MATTPKLGLPYPAGTDGPAGPTQIQQLATAIDNALSSITDLGSSGSIRIGSVLFEWGSVSIMFNNVATGSAPVNFPVAYGTAPRVFMTVNGNPFYLASTFATPTTTTFTAYIRQIDNVSSSGTVVVQWLAVGLA